MNNDFDCKLERPFKNYSISYGIIEGDNHIVFLKAGQGGSIYGYENKYLAMARNLNSEFGCTVITSSSPFDGTNPLDNAMEVIEEYCNRKAFNSKEIYYFGTSNGARIGLTWGAEYEDIKKLILVNSPVTINWMRLKAGASALAGDKTKEIWVVYGSKDISAKYAELFKPYTSDNFHLIMVEGADHYFRDHMDEFMNLPKALFYKENDGLLVEG